LFDIGNDARLMVEYQMKVSDIFSVQRLLRQVLLQRETRTCRCPMCVLQLSDDYAAATGHAMAIVDLEYTWVPR
jgi:hypothetical protein